MSEEQKTIYVVTSGEYSDYGINALFDDRAAAEAFIARFLPHPADDGRIQEWIVNEHTGPMRRGETPWLAHFDPRGTLIAIKEKKGEPNDGGAYIHQGGAHKGAGYWTGWARDEEHARKIAQEQIMQARARAEGMT